MFRVGVRTAFRGWLVPAAAVAGMLAAASSPVCAQVMEIGPHGSVVVYDVPAVFDAAGATPIRQKPLRAAPRRRSLVRTGAGISIAAAAAELSPNLVRAVAEQESGLRAGVVSHSGAVGEMQLMPSTARALGVDPRDSNQNYRGGAAYLRALLQRYDGDVVRALAAYNAGPRAVDHYRGTPPYRETQAYVAAVLERLSRVADAGA